VAPAPSRRLDDREALPNGGPGTTVPW